MTTVYAIHKFNQTKGCTEGYLGLYATKELAEKQLRIMREEIERGEWDGHARVTNWHDETEAEVTYMTVKRDYWDGCEYIANYAVEEVAVQDTVG